MKKQVKTAALFAVLSIMAVSCQKETIVEPNTGMQQTMSVRTVTYSIDGVSQQIVIRGDEAWMEFLRNLAALARQGYRVQFRCEETRTNASTTKEVVTYTTTSEEDAIAWCNSMSNSGYEVEMYYDEKNGKFVCTATK
ncbi:MAG: hypothetical protein IKP34_04550 [Bacteroidales bacterium]|nr:hypothetical protein [Bacteroidales bacterium]MBR4715428.1 hypothetical protein [Bacteroidales bacterium]